MGHYPQHQRLLNLGIRTFTTQDSQLNWPDPAYDRYGSIASLPRCPRQVRFAPDNRRDAERESTVSVISTPDRQIAMPILSVLELSTNVDASVVDDRSINKHLNVSSGERQTPILTTLDLLDDLAAKQVISHADLFAHRTTLRQAGYQLIPLTEDELSYHLANTRIVLGELVESAEMRAIRESWLKARMIRMLQIPAEAPWLQRSTGAVLKTVREIWRTEADHKQAAIYAWWLANFLDNRGWAPSVMPGNERAFAVDGYAAQMMVLSVPPSGLSREAKQAYAEWVEEYCFENIKYSKPEVFAWMVDRERALVEHSTRDALAGIED